MHFILVHSKEQFDKIKSQKPKRCINSVSKVICESQSADPLKKDIVIPRCGKIPNPKEFKLYRQRPEIQSMGYIRLKAHQNLPSSFTYELTDQDIGVLDQIKEKYSFEDSTDFELEQKHIALIFRWCEEISHSTDSQVLKIFSDEKMMSEHIADSFEGNFDEEQRKKLSSLVCELFHYWKIVKKDRFNEPLIRKYWPKEYCYSQVFNYMIPYKSRFPGILDPVIVPYELKAITKKSNQQTLDGQVKFISSLDEWKMLYKTHRKKRKEFQTMVNNFHKLASNCGFDCPSKNKHILDPSCKKTETEQSRDLRDFQVSKESIECEISHLQRTNLNRTEMQTVRPKKIESNKSATFMSVTEWIRHQKKMIRKEKKYSNSSEQIYKSIEILDDDQKDQVSIVEKTQFYEIALLEVQKQLQKQEVFKFLVKDDEEIDQYDDSMLGSENFYDDLDFENIPQPEDFFFQQQYSQKQRFKDTNSSNDDDQHSSNTTIFEEPSEFKKKRKLGRTYKRKTMFALKKKVKKG